MLIIADKDEKGKVVFHTEEIRDFILKESAKKTGKDVNQEDYFDRGIIRMNEVMIGGHKYKKCEADYIVKAGEMMTFWLTIKFGWGRSGSINKLSEFFGNKKYKEWTVNIMLSDNNNLLNLFSKDFAYDFHIDYYKKLSYKDDEKKK